MPKKPTKVSIQRKLKVVYWRNRCLKIHWIWQHHHQNKTNDDEPDAKLKSLEIHSTGSSKGNKKPDNTGTRFSLSIHKGRVTANKTGTSKVGAISKAQKRKRLFLKKNLKFLNFFFQKMSHSAEKCKRGTLWALLTYILLQNIKKLERGTLLRH